MRAFLALDLEQSWRDRCASLQRIVSEADRCWAGEKWVPPELMHVTVVFLGDVDLGVASRLGDEVAPLLTELAALRLVPCAVQARPGPRRARLLWVEFEPQPDLAGFAYRMAAVARELGIDVEQRPYIAHQTLVRSRRTHKVASEALASATHAIGEQGSVSVPSVTLFESVLGRTGPEYREVRTWRLS